MGVTYNQNNVIGRRNSGVTEYPITIGDGVNSWGRFNAEQKFMLYDFKRKNILNAITDVFDADIDNNGKIHVVFQDGANLSYRTNEGGTWSAATVIAAATATRMKLKISANGYLNVIYTTGAGNVKYAYKLVGAGAWSVGNTNIALVPGSLSMDIDSTNRIVIGIWDAGYYTSRQAAAAGSTFVGFTTTLITTGVAGRQKILIDSSDNIYLLTNNNAGATGVYLFDNTPSLVATIEATGVPITQINSESAEFDSNNNLHVVWKDITDFKIVYAYSAAPYSSVSTTTIVDTVGDTIGSHSLVLDQHNKTHILYHDTTGGIANLKYASNSNGSMALSNLDASASPFGSAGYITKMRLKNGNAVALYQDITVNVSALGLIAMEMQCNFKQSIATALSSAITSSNGKITILSGNYFLDSVIAINQNSMEISGESGTNVYFAGGQIKVGTIATSGVKLNSMKFKSSNLFMYDTAAQTAIPMLVLTPTTCTGCFVTDMIFDGMVGNSGETNIEKDIEWTIANGHIVTDNISTTNTSGLGGI